ncbi:hypothetical protein CLOP_g11080, partial [Closterium sp. NIES-67]
LDERKRSKPRLDERKRSKPRLGEQAKKKASDGAKRASASEANHGWTSVSEANHGWTSERSSRRKVRIMHARHYWFARRRLHGWDMRVFFIMPESLHFLFMCEACP